MDTTIADFLAEEGAAAEAGADLETPMRRNRTRAKDPAQVYSLRLPVERLEEVRTLAKREHVAPSALMRRWVLERLDQEQDRLSHAAEATAEYGHSNFVVFTRDELEAAVKHLLPAALEAMTAKAAASDPAVEHAGA